MGPVYGYFLGFKTQIMEGCLDSRTDDHSSKMLRIKRIESGESTNGRIVC